jgi:hypothetical protein
MDGACRMHGIDEKPMQNFRPRARRDDETWESYA